MSHRFLRQEAGWRRVPALCVPSVERLQWQVPDANAPHRSTNQLVSKTSVGTEDATAAHPAAIAVADEPAATRAGNRIDQVQPSRAQRKQQPTHSGRVPERRCPRGSRTPAIPTWPRPSVTRSDGSSPAWEPTRHMPSKPPLPGSWLPVPIVLQHPTTPNDQTTCPTRQVRASLPPSPVMTGGHAVPSPRSSPDSDR